MLSRNWGATSYQESSEISIEGTVHVNVFSIGMEGNQCLLFSTMFICKQGTKGVPKGTDYCSAGLLKSR